MACRWSRAEPAESLRVPVALREHMEAAQPADRRMRRLITSGPTGARMRTGPTQFISSGSSASSIAYDVREGVDAHSLARM